jgi:antitoxin VapB
MALNIKSPEAHELARQLARQTGESLTLAVTIALKERLDRLTRAESHVQRSERILEIGRRCATTMEHPTLDHAALLYDEIGAPK